VFTFPTVAALAEVAEVLPGASGLAFSGFGTDATLPLSFPAGAAEEGEEVDVVLRPDPTASNDPFPLIGIQKAYWIGIQLSALADDAKAAAVATSSRAGTNNAAQPNQATTLGGGKGEGGGAVQPVIFNEFEVGGGGVDVPRLELAWRALIRRHDLLRAVLTTSGNLVVLDADQPAPHLPRSAGGELADAFTVQVRAARFNGPHAPTSFHAVDC
jgi:hypothetical protein